MNTENLEVIYLTWHHACGKTELSHQLSLITGAPIIETGVMVRACYTQRDVFQKDLDIASFVRQKEEVNPLYFTLMLKDRISNAGLNTKGLTPARVLVIGMRSHKNILDLKEITPRWRHIITWIDVQSHDLLRRRYNQRENKNLDETEFNKLLAVDQLLGIEELRISADHIVTNGEGITIDNLLHQGLAALGLL